MGKRTDMGLGWDMWKEEKEGQEKEGRQGALLCLCLSICLSVLILCWSHIPVFSPFFSFPVSLCSLLPMTDEVVYTYLPLLFSNGCICAGIASSSLALYCLPP